MRAAGPGAPSGLASASDSEARADTLPTTVVPFVRVQHIDVTRGPFDKMFGTASLVVHTAGTHNSIVTLPGLSPERAAEIREAIRS